MTALSLAGQAALGATGPVRLQVDNLTTPLGLDDARPSFSWQLENPARGSKQTAYQVQVATSAELLEQDSVDMWDSSRMLGEHSLNVRYLGRSLAPSTRYFWRVKVWGVDGKPYAASAVSWWETGLAPSRRLDGVPAPMARDVWRGAWIGFETPEEAAVRHAAGEWITSRDAKERTEEKAREQHFAYRVSASLTKAVKRATLYATGEDTVSAWVNGEQVIKAAPLPPYKQMPWKKFVRADVTEKVASGVNSVAIECVHYVVNPSGFASEAAPPMIATLFVEYADGSVATLASGEDWKSAVHAPEGWQKKAFDDSGWKHAIVWPQAPGPMQAPAGHPWIPDSVKLLRHTFQISKSVKSARLYATALGSYEIFLNGKRVGQDVLAPGWTDYRERVTYQTYDVTDLLTRGNNAIGALLAPGWYETPLEWFQQPNNYGDTPPALRAQLRIEDGEGQVEWVTTSAEWQASSSYILDSEIYDGENQDARLEQPGWDTAQFEAGGWKEALVVSPKPVKIEAQDFEPIGVELEMPVLSVNEPKPGVYVYDFGQNMSGVERLRVSGPAGTKVQIRFAEIVNPDGTLYTDNLRTAKATDSFVLSGKGVEEFTPQFTFHGFRYAEITGLPTAPNKDALAALVIHTDARFGAELKTGNQMINKLWSNIVWGQRSNLVGLPTDCPQRDERLGWMADAQVFWRAATYNMDLTAFTRKFAADMRGTQVGTPFYGIYSPGTWQENTGYGAGWSDAGLIIPWTSWLQSGDTRVIDENWQAMDKYLAAIAESNPDGLWKNSGIPFGDWLSPEGRTDQELIATAYWAYDLILMGQMARATGRTADAEKLEKQFDKIRDAFQRQFVHADGFVAGADNSPSPFGQIDNPNAKSAGGDTQTGYVLALHMNLVPESLRGPVAQKLVDKIEANHDLLGTGFLGTPYLLEELTKAGRADLAYKLLLNTQYPSWGYLVEHGATTMWERWNGDQMKGDPSMNSYNHYAYGAVADWIYRYAAGVDATPTDAGFHTVVLHPHFDAQLGSVDFSYPSSYGLIGSKWTVEGATAEWQVTIPANTTGRLVLGPSEAVRYKLEGVPLTQSELVKATNSGFELPSGTYLFAVQIQ